MDADGYAIIAAILRFHSFLLFALRFLGYFY